MAEERYPYTSYVWGICLMIAGVLAVVTAGIAFLPSENGGAVRGMAPAMVALIVPLLAFAGFAYSREGQGARAVILSEETLSAPPNALSRAPLIVRYTDISDISVVRFKTTTTLRVGHPGGVIGIPGGALGAADAMVTLETALRARVAKAKVDA